MKVSQHQALSEFSLDHLGNDTSDLPEIERLIQAIPPDIEPLQRATKIQPVFRVIASIDNPAERSAWVEKSVNWFYPNGDPGKRGFADDCKALLRSLITERKGQDKVEAATPKLSPDAFAEELMHQGMMKSIHPLQDFHDSQMYFTIRLKGEPYLIRSDRSYFRHSEAATLGVKLEPFDFEEERALSNAAVASFIRDDHSESAVDLFDDICQHIRRFVYFIDPKIPQFLALWCMGTYVHRVFAAYPYVSLLADKQSGKSLLMQVMTPICFGGDVCINLSEASLFRDVAQTVRTLFIDEAEALTSWNKDKNSAIFTLLNAGYQKNAKVKRQVQKADRNFETQSYRLYSPKMFAGINSLDEVLQSRTIPLQLVRKRDSEAVEKYRERMETKRIESLRDRCYLFALRFANDIADLYQSDDLALPEHLTNREEELWTPIFILADCIDAGNGDSALRDSMAALSQSTGRTKTSRDQTENRSVILLRTLLEMFDSHSPLPERAVDEEGWISYTKRDVYQYFKDTDDFSQINSQSSLSRKFNRLSLSPELPCWRSKGQTRQSGKLHQFHIARLTELWERQTSEKWLPVT